MPHEEREAKWVADGLVTECPLCRKTFFVVTRRHHCRLCGRVCCNACTLHRSLYENTEQHSVGWRRTCSDCWGTVQTSEVLLPLPTYAPAAASAASLHGAAQFPASYAAHAGVFLELLGLVGNSVSAATSLSMHSYTLALLGRLAPLLGCGAGGAARSLLGPAPSWDASGRPVGPTGRPLPLPGEPGSFVLAVTRAGCASSDLTWGLPPDTSWRQAFLASAVRWLFSLSLYDARTRTLLRALAHQLGVPWAYLAQEEDELISLPKSQPPSPASGAGGSDAQGGGDEQGVVPTEETRAAASSPAAAGAKAESTPPSPPPPAGSTIAAPPTGLTWRRAAACVGAASGTLAVAGLAVAAAPIVAAGAVVLGGHTALAVGVGHAVGYLTAAGILGGGATIISRNISSDLEGLKDVHLEPLSHRASEGAAPRLQPFACTIAVSGPRFGCSPAAASKDGGAAPAQATADAAARAKAIADAAAPWGGLENAQMPAAPVPRGRGGSFAVPPEPSAVAAALAPRGRGGSFAPPPELSVGASAAAAPSSDASGGSLASASANGLFAPLSPLPPPVPTVDVDTVLEGDGAVLLRPFLPAQDGALLAQWRSAPPAGLQRYQELYSALPWHGDLQGMLELQGDGSVWGAQGGQLWLIYSCVESAPCVVDYPASLAPASLLGFLAQAPPALLSRGAAGSVGGGGSSSSLGSAPVPRPKHPAEVRLCILQEESWWKHCASDALYTYLEETRTKKLATCFLLNVCNVCPASLALVAAPRGHAAGGGGSGGQQVLHLFD